MQNYEKNLKRQKPPGQRSIVFIVFEESVLLIEVEVFRQQGCKACNLLHSLGCGVGYAVMP